MSEAQSTSAIVAHAVTSADVAAITRCVCAACPRYIERAGKQPWPMLQDYSNVIRTSQVHVAERDGEVLAVLELLVTDQGFLLDSMPSILPPKVLVSGDICSCSPKMKQGATGFNRSA